MVVVMHAGYQRRMSKDIGRGQLVQKLYECWQSAGSNQFFII